MVKATVCCTKCATKFTQEFPKNNWGDMIHVVCPDGHTSFDVLSEDTKQDSNSLHVTELFDRPDDDVEDDNGELALT